MCLESSCENLLLGTEGGNIFFIDLSTFELSDNIIYQDVVMQKYVSINNFNILYIFNLK